MAPEKTLGDPGQVSLATEDILRWTEDHTEKLLLRSDRGNHPIRRGTAGPTALPPHRTGGAQGRSPSVRDSVKVPLLEQKGQRWLGWGGGGGRVRGPVRDREREGPRDRDQTTRPERRQVAEPPSRCCESARARAPRRWAARPRRPVSRDAMRPDRPQEDVWREERRTCLVAAFISSTQRRSARWPGRSTVGGSRADRGRGRARS